MSWPAQAASTSPMQPTIANDLMPASHVSRSERHLKAPSMVSYMAAMNEPGRQFTLDELATLTGTPVRTIRFYIQQGLVPRPEGVARGAHYGPTHLEALLSISRWQKFG